MHTIHHLQCVHGVQLCSRRQRANDTINARMISPSTIDTQQEIRISQTSSWFPRLRRPMLCSRGQNMHETTRGGANPGTLRQ